MKCVICLLIILAAVCCCGCTHHSDRIIVGVKIYDYQGDYAKLTGKWKEMGINTAFVSTSLAANDTFRQNSGKETFQSISSSRFFRIRKS